MCDTLPDIPNDALSSPTLTGVNGDGDKHTFGHLSNGKIEAVAEQNVDDGDHVEARVDTNGDAAAEDDDGPVKSAENSTDAEKQTDSLEIEPEVIEDGDVDEETVDEMSGGGVQYVDKSTNDIRCVDADGWEDLLGSGRLRKRVIVEGDPSNHPAKGSQVKVHFKGKSR